MNISTRLFIALGLLLSHVAAKAASHTIQVGPNGSLLYAPATLTIQPGDQVTFQWVSGSHPTQLTSSPGPTSPSWSALPSSTFSMNQNNTSQTFTFTTPGQYNYVCLPHQALNMQGSITVSRTTPSRGAQGLSNALSVYPNPVHGGQATIGFGEAKSGQNYQVRISNIIGREVRSVTVRSELMQAGQAIDLSSLPSGIYFCTLLANDKAVATKRVTVQN